MEFSSLRELDQVSRVGVNDELDFSSHTGDIDVVRVSELSNSSIFDKIGADRHHFIDIWRDSTLHTACRYLFSCAEGKVVTPKKEYTFESKHGDIKFHVSNNVTNKSKYQNGRNKSQKSDSVEVRRSFASVERREGSSSIRPKIKKSKIGSGKALD